MKKKVIVRNADTGSMDNVNPRQAMPVILGNLIAVAEDAGAKYIVMSVSDARMVLAVMEPKKEEAKHV